MTPDYRFRLRVLGLLTLALMAVAIALTCGVVWGRVMDQLVWFTTG